MYVLFPFRFTTEFLDDGTHAVRKAVFSMMAMKRMSMMAHHLTPEHHQLNEEVFQLKQESEKESLEHADVLHHHNADSQSQHDATLQPNSIPEGTAQPQINNEASVAQGFEATGAAVSEPAPPVPAKENKDVVEKPAAASLAASAKVSGKAKRI